MLMKTNAAPRAVKMVTESSSSISEHRGYGAGRAFATDDDGCAAVPRDLDLSRNSDRTEDVQAGIDPFDGERDKTKPAKNTICLWYNRDAEEAARFYAKTFPDSSVGAGHRAPG